jgi:hypothetical protein
MLGTPLKEKGQKAKIFKPKPLNLKKIYLSENYRYQMYDTVNGDCKNLLPSHR